MPQRSIRFISKLISKILDIQGEQNTKSKERSEGKTS